MAITLNNPIQVQPDTASVVWVQNLNIIAQDPSKPVRAMVTVCPVTTSGSLVYDQRKSFTIPDVLTYATTDVTASLAVSWIYAVVQNKINELGLYATGSSAVSGSV